MSIKKALSPRDNMEQILKIHIESGDFHHGYLLAGDFELSRAMAFEAANVILSPNGKLETHPDFFYQTFELFGINDTHDLIARVSQRPFFGQGKVFVIEILAFSLESANALLKTLEEPNEGNYFFILVPSAENVIPTLRSRLTLIDNTLSQKNIEAGKEKIYAKFLVDLPNRRLETVKNIQDDKYKAMEFLNELEVVIEKMVRSNKAEAKALEEIERSKNFLFDRGSSTKMILEHLALSLPQLL